MNQASSFEQAFDQMVEQFGHEQRIPLSGWKQLRAILRTTEPDSKFDPVQYWQDRYGKSGQSPALFLAAKARRFRLATAP